MIDPKKQDFTLYQGATWEHNYVVLNEITGLPEDIGGCTAKMQAREDVDDVLPVIDISGQIGGSNGQIKFVIDPTMSVGQVWERAGYDAELMWPNGKIDKLGYGKFKLQREYTTS